MCADKYVISRSASPTSRGHSGTPKGKSELSYEGGGRGAAFAQPQQEQVTGKGMKMHQN